MSNVVPHFNQKKAFLKFRGMELFYILKLRKKSLHLRKQKPPKKTLMFQEAEFSYISHFLKDLF